MRKQSLSRGRGRRGRTRVRSEMLEQEIIFREVLQDDFGKEPSSRGLKKGRQVKLFVVEEGKAVEVGSANLGTAGAADELLQRNLHLHELPSSAELDLVVITSTSFKEEQKGLSYPYKFKGGEGVPKTLEDMFPQCFYAWETRMMIPTNEALHQPASEAPPQLDREAPPQPASEASRQPVNEALHQLADETLRQPTVEKAKEQTPRKEVEKSSEAGRSGKRRKRGNEADQREGENQPYTSNTQLDAGGISGDASKEVIVIDDVEETFAERGRKVDIRHYDVTNYEKEDIWISLDEIVVPRLSLRDVDMPSVLQLQDRFRKFGYDYSSGLMTVTVLKSMNEELKDLEPSSLVEEGKRALNSSKEVVVKQMKRGLKATVVDGMHRRTALMLLRAEPSRGESMKWLDEPIRMTLQTRSDKQDMRSTEILFVGMQRNQVSSTVRAFSGLEQHVTGIVSYLKSFAEEARLTVLQVRPSNLADEMNSSKFITGMSRDTYRRYARIAKVFAMHKNALTHLKEINGEDDVKLGAAHVDNSLFYEVDEVGVILLLDGVAAYVRNPETSGKFENVRFFEHVKASYLMLMRQYEKLCLKQKLSFQTFLDVKIKQSSYRSSSIRNCFTNNVRLFNVSKRSEAKNLERIKRFEARIENHFVQELRAAAVRESPSARNGEPEAINDDGAARYPMRSVEQSTKPSAKPCPGERETEASHAVPRSAAPSPVSASRNRRSDRKRKAPRTQEPSEEWEVQVAKRRKRSETKTRRRRHRSSSAARQNIVQSVDDEEDYGVAVEVGKDRYREAAVAEESERTFDDVISPLSSHLMRHNAPYVGEKEPSWQFAVTLSPTKAVGLLHTAKSEGSVIHHTPWLSALHIPVEHRGHAFLSMDALLYHQKLAWLLAAKMHEEELGGMEKMAMKESQEGWAKAKERYETDENGYSRAYFEKNSILLQQRGFCVLKGFADSSYVPVDILKDLKPPTDMSKRTVQEMFEKFESTFPGEDALKDESNRTLWSPIINEGEEDGDVNMRNSGRARFSSTRFLLVDHVEGKESLQWVSERRAILDAWLGQLAVLLGLNKYQGARMSSPRTGGRFLITGKGCPRQAAHNDFQVPERAQKNRCPGYFMITTGKDPSPLWICEYSHHFVFGTRTELHHFAKALNLRKVIIPANSVFVGHGYITHAGAGYSDRTTDNVALRYHIYFIPEGISLPDSVFFAFGLPPKFAEDEIRAIPQAENGKERGSVDNDKYDVNSDVELEELNSDVEEDEYDKMAYLSNGSPSE